MIILVNHRISPANRMPGQGGLVRRVLMREISKEMPVRRRRRKKSSGAFRKKKVYRKGAVNRFDAMGKHSEDGQQVNEICPIKSQRYRESAGRLRA